MVPDINNHAEVIAMLGKRVRVVLHKPHPGDRDVAVISEGTFLGFGDGGDVQLEEDDGFVHYCWPMLDIEEVTQPESKGKQR